MLIFVEGQLTLLAIAKPENQLQKGSGYHYDLLLMGFLNGFCSLLGFPWLCAAAIRSIQHFNTLRIFDKTIPPGVKPKLTNVCEQRITSLVIHVLIRKSIVPFCYGNIMCISLVLMPAMSFLIKLIPVPVLLGLFVYLCYVSINGIQLATRVQLLFIPAKYHPKLYYVRKVSLSIINIFMDYCITQSGSHLEDAHVHNCAMCGCCYIVGYQTVTSINSLSIEYHFTDSFKEYIEHLLLHPQGD